MKKNVPDVSIVVISWKMKELLFDMLSSLYAWTKGITFEVIVVDNDSRDGTAEMVTHHFPEVVLMRNPVNRGVAPARNMAFRVARARYIASLDADVMLTENSLRIMKDYMDQHSGVGLCGCMLISPNNSIQFSARRFPSLRAQLYRRLSGLRWFRDSAVLENHEMKEWDRKDSRKIDYVIGACQFIRRDAMEAVGLYDETIFYGPEDIDYCLRMHRRGWEVHFCAETRMVHKEQRATRRRLLSRLTVSHLRGIFHFYRKEGWTIRP